MEVYSLASGSSGNSVLFKSGTRYLLIDAGLGVRRLMPALHRLGVVPASMEAVLLTHEHGDHTRAAQQTSRKFGTPIAATRGTLESLAAWCELSNVSEIDANGEIKLGPFDIRSFSIPHDAADPVGYVVQADGATVAYATDIGCATPIIQEAMNSASLCIIEANHDTERLFRGPYPVSMKVRIAGNRGHLSNEEAANIIVNRLEASGPASIWLAHLSAVNNSPSFAKRYVTERVKRLTSIPCHIDVALRDQPSLVWRTGCAVQLTLL